MNTTTHAAHDLAAELAAEEVITTAWLEELAASDVVGDRALASELRAATLSTNG